VYGSEIDLVAHRQRVGWSSQRPIVFCFFPSPQSIYEQCSPNGPALNRWCAPHGDLTRLVGAMPARRGRPLGLKYFEPTP